MAIDKIWVFAQDADGAPTSATLELLTKARSLGGGVAAFVAGDGSSAAALGEYGASGCIRRVIWVVSCRGWLWRRRWWR